MRKIASIFLAAATAVALGTALTACDEGEQGRVLFYEEGTYLGKPDPALPEQTVEEFDERARLQGRL